MNSLGNALRAEFLKLRRQQITWITFVAFSIGPLMGVLFMVILEDPGFRSGALGVKADLMSFSSTWPSYFLILTQVVGVGGVMIFGFVASWIFGSEYSQSTVKDLLAMPTPRTEILHAKFAVYFAWCFALALSNLLIAFFTGSIIGLDFPGVSDLVTHLIVYATTTLMVTLLGSPIAFFAMRGRGYLVPLGFVALMIVFSQVIAATGVGQYFPWAIPGLYSGVAGDMKLQLDAVSYVILGVTFLAGYFACVAWFTRADQLN
jgi:ABC-2 type transport system permease protein